MANIAKSKFIILPWPVKFFRAIYSSLKDLHKSRKNNCLMIVVMLSEVVTIKRRLHKLFDCLEICSHQFRM